MRGLLRGKLYFTMSGLGQGGDILQQFELYCLNPNSTSTSKVVEIGPKIISRSGC